MQLLRGFSLLISLLNCMECLILLEVMNAHLPFISMGNTHTHVCGVCVWDTLALLDFHFLRLEAVHRTKTKSFTSYGSAKRLWACLGGGSWIQMKFYGPVDLLIAPQVLSVLKLNLNMHPSPLYFISTSLLPTSQKGQLIRRGAVTYCLPNRFSLDLS